MNLLPRSSTVEANTRKGIFSIRDLLVRETQDVRAAEALALFCCQVEIWIGAFGRRGAD